MLDWSMTDLARAAHVSLSTVQRGEEYQPQPVSDEVRARSETLWKTLAYAFCRTMAMERA